MPPVLRICTGADWPRKKTVSGKSLGVMSLALRTTSLPSAGIDDEVPAFKRCGAAKRETAARRAERRRSMVSPFEARNARPDFGDCTRAPRIKNPFRWDSPFRPSWRQSWWGEAGRGDERSLIREEQ